MQERFMTKLAVTREKRYINSSIKQSVAVN